MVFRQSFRQILILIVSCTIISSKAHLQQPGEWQALPYDIRSYDDVIRSLYQQVAQAQLQDLPDRITYFSAAFLGKPYELGALGEGTTGQYNQNPWYRTDRFDCLTYVTTVLALVKGHTLEDFRYYMANIQYKSGQIDFFQRHHFISLDWNIENQRQGFVKSIVREITNQAGWPIYKTARTYINKRAWYQYKSFSDLKILKSISLKEAQQLLQKLKTIGATQKNAYSEIDYLPLNQLFDREGKPNFYLFSQIPNGAIIQIIRPDWRVEKKIGTRLNVSHMGFVIYTPVGIMFREASRTKGEVSDTPLIDYLREYLNSSTVKGIHVLVIQK